VLVSDYGCGLLDASLVRAALAFARRRRIPVTVDSRFGLLRFRGMTAVTPNEPEVEEALGVTIGHDRRRRLITACFNSKDQHGFNVSMRQKAEVRSKK